MRLLNGAKQGGTTAESVVLAGEDDEIVVYRKDFLFQGVKYEASFDGRTV